MGFFDAIMRPANRLATGFAATALGLATLAVLIQIGVRFVLPPLGIIISAPWTEESARFLMTWSVFIGVAVLCRRGGLIAVTVLPSAVPEQLAKWIIAASTALSGIFFLVLLIIGWQWAGNAWGETATVLRIPMGLVYAAMPLGAALSLVNLLLYVKDVFAGPAQPASSTLQVE